MACQIEAARPASRPHHQPLPPSLSWVEEELDALGTANLLRPRRLRDLPDPRMRAARVVNLTIPHRVLVKLG